ncbi:MAG: pilus assembly protein TadC [Crenarchaeota archaeon]|nr:MAG: pilus assembly protein TadC [Thermoproteota archaeon]RDJ34201.1 MAG: pilus assembly protein TadC [Thermoproteota archaeon]RDJ37175.1 MAG: pilus assembly protein TadC [Thermoproteota archaeon]RDJ37944.1 MAG: pilus assembly protein TadC [Thermoproteota archaeon]
MTFLSSQNKSKKHDEATSSLQVLSYRLLKNHVQPLYPRLASLEKNLKQAMMPIPFDVYVCSMVFFSLIAGIVGVAVSIAAAFFVNIQPVAFAFLLPILAGCGIGTATFFVLQMLPSINVKNRASKLTEELPHFIGYMATLATSGLALEGIFKAIANEDSDEEIVKDCRFITRNIEILGMDLVSAIADLIKRAPKGPYAELLEGAIITVQTGGNLKEYFIATAKVQLEEKKMALRKSTESLGVMAEMYTILLIVFPLMAVIMLSIMAIMSPDLAGFDLIQLMNLLTYVLVPFFGVLLLFMMDSMVPKR